MDLNKESYNQIADEWEISRKKSFLSSLIVDFAQRIKPGGKILDVGCGCGYPIAFYLAHQGFTVTGIDFAEHMIKKATALQLPGAQFYHTDFFDFETDVLFDGVMAFDSFFHFPHKSQRSIYPKLANLIRSGGYALFTHGLTDGEMTNDMFGKPFYYSSLDKKVVERLLYLNELKIEYSLEKYIEKNTDRDWVVLCRKI